MLSLSLILAVIALVLLVVALIAYLSPNHGGISLPLTIVAGILIAIVLIVGAAGVGYVHFGTVR